MARFDGMSGYILKPSAPIVDAGGTLLSAAEAFDELLLRGASQ